MHPNQKIKVSEYCMKIDPQMKIAADFNNKNIPEDDYYTDSFWILFVN